MAFIIFGDSFTFPDGNASTNRVYTYARGFTESGIGVYVICFRNDYMDNYNGEADGIKYYHPFGQTERNNYFIIRSWQKLTKYFKTFSLLRQINRSDRIFAIHCYTRIIPTQLFGFILSKYFRFILTFKENP